MLTALLVLRWQAVMASEDEDDEGYFRQLAGSEDEGACGHAGAGIGHCVQTKQLACATAACSSARPPC